MPPRRRVFLLSPAHCGGKRAAFLLNGAATLDLATRLRGPAGAPLGEAFSFLSGLYFRGKLAYARAFARPGDVCVITSDRGLVSPDAAVTLDELRRMACVPVDLHEPRYREPLEHDVRRLAERLRGDGEDAAAEVVLLGSIATSKYVDVLAGVLGGRLAFPADFVGRGDMSRGALLLRAVAAGRELAYVPVAGVARRGRRAPRVDQR
jgi:hypothetical protein